MVAVVVATGTGVFLKSLLGELLGLPLAGGLEELEVEGSCLGVVGEDVVEVVLVDGVVVGAGAAFLDLARELGLDGVDGGAAVGARGAHFRGEPRFSQNDAVVLGAVVLEEVVGALPHFPRAAGVARLELVLRKRDPDLDVLRLFEQPLVQVRHAPARVVVRLDVVVVVVFELLASSFAVLEPDFKVDVGFPEEVGLVEDGLLDAQVVDRSRAREFADVPLEIGELRERPYLRGRVLHELGEDGAAPVHFSKLPLQLDVA
mmetsp:Transcript_14354/g.43463  ORF Transcript_14354/g.43463 Transcript_14354/m.43463 type:complete len:260 (-) Transcript_14354:95-874(-)